MLPTFRSAVRAVRELKARGVPQREIDRAVLAYVTGDAFRNVIFYGVVTLFVLWLAGVARWFSVILFLVFTTLAIPDVLKNLALVPAMDVLVGAARLARRVRGTSTESLGSFSLSSLSTLIRAVEALVLTVYILFLYVKLFRS